MLFNRSGGINILIRTSEAADDGRMRFAIALGKLFRTFPTRTIITIFELGVTNNFFIIPISKRRTQCIIRCLLNNRLFFLRVIFLLVTRNRKNIVNKFGVPRY